MRAPDDALHHRAAEAQCGAMPRLVRRPDGMREELLRRRGLGVVLAARVGREGVLHSPAPWPPWVRTV